jgi:hypothetical protein
MGMGLQSRRVFLFADDEMLSDPSASILNCMDADYLAEDGVPQNRRTEGRQYFQRNFQRYFGWIPIRVGSVANLWIRLVLFEMSDIAPPTTGGSHSVV